MLKGVVYVFVCALLGCQKLAGFCLQGPVSSLYFILDGWIEVVLGLMEYGGVMLLSSPVL
jgi:hypothetical protein